MVADGERLSLGCMVAAIIARKSFPEARFHFSVPADAPFNLGLPESTLEAELVRFTPQDQDLQVEGKGYRILNKVRALWGFEETLNKQPFAGHACPPTMKLAGQRT